MKREALSDNSTKNRALTALREALIRYKPTITVNDKGYAEFLQDNLLSAIAVEDFKADLQAGDGKELEGKFRAAHSSSALVVNSFAPFRTQIADLRLLDAGPFDQLEFEKKCPTGLQGIPPNLDVLLSGPNNIIGVESKLTEYLGKHSGKFSIAYRERIRDERRGQPFFREMLRLIGEPDSYIWLDAAQLIKHAFGLAHTFRGKSTTLLYLYWEPLNPECSSVFGEHRKEISEFAQRVEGSKPSFEAMSYPALWSQWAETAPEWITKHLEDLGSRYLVSL